jgi:hypothetical protein
MIVVNLEKSYCNCPVYWQNFIDELQEFSYEEVTLFRIQKFLEPYKARYVLSKYVRDYLEFGDEKLYTMFVLRYS